jgi:hypothetical protein
MIVDEIRKYEAIKRKKENRLALAFGSDERTSKNSFSVCEKTVVTVPLLSSQQKGQSSTELFATATVTVLKRIYRTSEMSDPAFFE